MCSILVSRYTIMSHSWQAMYLKLFPDIIRWALPPLSKVPLFSTLRERLANSSIIFFFFEVNVTNDYWNSHLPEKLVDSVVKKNDHPTPIGFGKPQKHFSTFNSYLRYSGHINRAHLQIWVFYG